MDAPKCKLCGKSHWGACATVSAPAARLPEHHRAWLKAHSFRTSAWLAAQIADGFEVHHIDRDHQNNDPANLVLIEAVDHALLHRLLRAADPMRKPFDRTAYQREYMRRRRGKAL